MAEPTKKWTEGIFNPKVTEGEIGYLATRVSRAIWDSFNSPNEMDSNLETANVVDGLYRIAGALHHVARAIERTEGLKGETDA